MYELGQIFLKDETSLVESRNKIFNLAVDLQFGQIGATRIATVTSELARKMIKARKPSSVVVELGHCKGVFGLILRFKSNGLDAGVNAKALSLIFDSVEMPRGEEDAIKAFKALPVTDFEISDAFIARERALIGRLTRDELHVELKAAYGRLESQTAQMIQSEKMRTVGTMVAGVAHELNNPMMGILNYSQYCQKHTLHDDRTYGVLQDIEKETRRCAGIVSNMLQFSHTEAHGGEELQKADCTELFERVLKLQLYRIEKERVSVARHYDESIPAIRVKINKLQQVFLNLINNALDAIKEKDAGKGEINIYICCEGENLKITVTDTGNGMDHEAIQRIFEPFFTTKLPGEGTGLGLSLSHGIVKEHGGEITCKSKQGTGTSVMISLPIK